MSDAYNYPFDEEITTYSTSDFANEPTEVVHLDGLPIPVKGPIGYTNLAVFQPKVTIGDFTSESDQILSVWIQSDWTGGGQIEDLNESSDVQRFRHATLDTRYPNILTLPPETLSYTISGATEARGIGDYSVSGTRYYWAAFDATGAKLRKWNSGTLAWDGGAALTAMPVNKGVVFDGLLWIPLGTTGYDTWDGATVVTSSSVTPISFVEWDDKLVALEHDGQISFHQSGSTGWDVRPELKLKGDRTPRNLVVWWTPEREPAIYVVTDRDVWVVDPLVPTLYRTGLRFPVHPDQGLGSCAWRDDSMYVSVGVGCHQLSLGGVVSAMGLDHDHGLPRDLRGKIVDLEPEYNGLLALIEGIGTTAIGSDDETLISLEETMAYGDALIVPTAATLARSTLQRWTSIGWHTVWESSGAIGAPTNVQVSNTGSDYRLWWGYGGSMYTQQLRRTFHNPKQGAQLGIDRFALSGSLKSGRFDASMKAYHKLASHFEVFLDPSSTQNVDVYYQTDHEASWKYLGTASDPGRTVLLFDPDGDGFAEGESFHWIEFDYRMTSTDALETPIVNWFTLKFVKLPLQTRSWRLNIPLARTEQWTGRGPREIADQLDSLASGERYVTFKTRDETYRVRVAQVSGDDSTGDDLSGSRLVSLIELDPASEPGGLT